MDNLPYISSHIFKIVGPVLVSRDYVHIDQKTIPETERYFFFNQPATFKSSLLGSGSASPSKLNESVEQDAVDLNLLWFSDFLKTSRSKGDENEALVVVFFRVVRRTETLDQHFIDTKMFDYQVESGGWATHLVEQVVYGAELICSMSRPVDWQRETKNSAEENIYFLAKTYFDQIIGPNAINTELPTELDKMSCRILSSLEDVQPTETSFRQSCEFLRDVVNFKEDHQPAKLWRPIYIVRRQIPNQIETRILLDKIIDDRFKIERKLHWIMSESRRISKHPFLMRIPPLEKVIYQFIGLLQPLEKEIMKFDVNLIASQKWIENRQNDSQEKITNDMKTVEDCVLLSNMVDWLLKRRSEIDAICGLFKGTPMDMLDMEEIETRPPSHFEKRARVFVLKIDYVADPLMDCIQNLIGGSSNTNSRRNKESILKLPVFPAISSGRTKRLGMIRKAFDDFSEEARWGSNEKNVYHIGFVPASLTIKDATIKTIYYPAAHYQQQQSPRISPAVPPKATCLLLPVLSSSKLVEHQQPVSLPSTSSLSDDSGVSKNKIPTGLISSQRPTNSKKVRLHHLWLN